MSKSLKNFTKIKDVLSYCNSQTLRLYFNSVKYDQVLNYEPSSKFAQFAQLDSTIRQFVMNSKSKLRNQNDNITNYSQKFNENEAELL